MVNSMLVTALAGVDIYYIGKDVVLLARLVGGTQPVFDVPSADNHWAILTLLGVVTLLILRVLWNRRQWGAGAAA